MNRRIAITTKCQYLKAKASMVLITSPDFFKAFNSKIKFILFPFVIKCMLIGVDVMWYNTSLFQLRSLIYARIKC